MKRNQAKKNWRFNPIPEWRKHYERLLDENRPEGTIMNPRPNKEELDGNIGTTVKEVITALSKMMNGRPPGPRNILVELLKAGGPCLLNRITELMNNCSQQIQVPSKLKIDALGVYF